MGVHHRHKNFKAKYLATTQDKYTLKQRKKTSNR